MYKLVYLYPQLYQVLRTIQPNTVQESPLLIPAEQDIVYNSYTTIKDKYWSGITHLKQVDNLCLNGVGYSSTKHLKYP